jgi:hypothetical protein
VESELHTLTLAFCFIPDNFHQVLMDMVNVKAIYIYCSDTVHYRTTARPTPSVLQVFVFISFFRLAYLSYLFAVYVTVLHPPV